MRSYLSFVKKEIMEYYKTYKLMIIFVVFLIISLISPLFAKFTPEILKMAGLDSAALGLPKVSMIDSWAQFFKNIDQLGVIVLIIIFSGIIANEFSKGTLINMLTKGLKRGTVILSKLTAAVLIWTVAYLLCLGICYCYTIYYFPVGELQNAFISFSGMWLYVVLLISLVMFGGILFKNIYGSLLFAGGSAALMAIVNIAPSCQKFNPITLSTSNVALLTAKQNLPDVLPAIFITIGLIILLTISSILLFNKKQL